MAFSGNCKKFNKKRVAQEETQEANGPIHFIKESSFGGNLVGPCHEVMQDPEPLADFNF